MSQPVLDLETVAAKSDTFDLIQRPDIGGLRVLHCIHSLYGGGAERQLKLIAAASHQVGLRPAIFCIKTDTNEKLDLPIYQAHLRSKFDISVYGAVQDAIRAFKPDIVHAWLPASITIPSMIAAKISGIPCVYSYRNAMRFHRPLSFVEYIAAALCSQRIVSNNPISQSIAAYRALYRAKSGQVIPNAVQVPPHFRKTRPQSSKGGPAQLLFVGRLTRQKNVDCLIRALAMLPTELDWRQLICGAGEEEAALKRLAKELGVEDRITFSGYRHDIYALMQSSDLLILPSWWEGMPNVLLEGLAVGLPCIASDISANRAVLNEDCCTFFDPAAPQRLAQAIADLWHDPTRLEHQAQAGFRLASEHSIDALLEKYAAFYHSIATPLDAYAAAPSGRS